MMQKVQNQLTRKVRESLLLTQSLISVQMFKDSLMVRLSFDFIIQFLMANVLNHVDLEDEVEISPLYHLSTLSGPIAMLAVISAECLIPLHNVLKEPQYWYEHLLILAFGLMPFFISGTVNFAIYWAKFTFEKKWISYLEIMGVGYFTFLVALIAYGLVWSQYLGYFQPMPHVMHVTGYPTLTAMMAFIGYRYSSTYLKYCKLAFSTRF